MSKYESNGHSLTAKIETITPDDAYELMERTKKWYEKQGRPHNFKPLNDNVVVALANDIRKGRWELNGEAIKLDDRGLVIDGQHRLEACMLSERPIRTMVVRGVHDKMIMDVGRSRTLAHFLRSAGEKYFSIASTVVKHMARTADDGTFSPNEARKWLSAVDGVDLFRRNRKEIIGAINDVIGWCPRNPVISYGVAAYALIMARRFGSKTKADDFVYRAMTGEELGPTSPILHLRKKFIAVKASKGSEHMQPWAAICFVIKAWKMYLAGEPCEGLRFAQNEKNPSWGGK